jgi:hypothetical protein
VEGGEVRVGDQVKGGDSCSGITAVSIKNQEQGVSFKTRGVNYFLHLKVGCVVLGLRLLHPKNADFSKVLLNFKVWCLGTSLPDQNQLL